MIRFLKPCSAPKGTLWRCGDGCCSGFDWENYDFEEGDEIEEYRVDVSGLTKGIDYVEE